MTITATDGKNSSVSYLDIEITDINETPDITSSLAYATVYENETARRDLLTVVASDQDGDVITYSVLATYPATTSFLINTASKIYMIT